MMSPLNNKIALVLGGGSARGLAHVGVIKVLHEARIPIDFIVGTSVGALVGATYALGIPLDVIEERALKIKLWHLTDFSISKFALLRGKSLEKVIKNSIENKNFTDLKIPLAIVATDIENGQRVVLTEGDLAQCIRASCTLPGVFAPIRINDKLLIDGGLLESVPARVAQQMGATFIIACDVGFCIKKEKISNLFQMVYQSIQIAGNELNKLQAKNADITIMPQLSSYMDQMAFDKAPEIVKKGEEAARKTLPLILSRLEEAGHINKTE